MGRRGKGGPKAGGDSAVDIMTALIGCLILILIGILVIVLVTQTMIIIVTPDEKDIKSVVTSSVDGMREENAFPFGNREKEPTYIDVHANRIVILDYDAAKGDVEISARELETPGNLFETKVLELEADKANQYAVLLVRPGAPILSRRLRKILHDDRHIDLGYELVSSTDVFEGHRSATKSNLYQNVKSEL